MKIFRTIVASVLILAFSLAAMAGALIYSFSALVNERVAEEVIQKSKAGERLSAALPDIIKEGLTGPAAQLRLEDIKKFSVEALSPEQADAMIKSVSADVVKYVRGERENVPKVDFAPIVKRAEAAAKKAFPGLVGTQLALMIQEQFKNSEIEKGLEIPRQQLDAAKTYYSQMRLAIVATAASLLVMLLLIFAVSPHGLAGRLRWCSAAFGGAGLLSAAVALMLVVAREFIAGLAFGGNAPPEIKDMMKDAAGTLVGMLSKDMLIAAALCIGVGAVLALLVFVLRKADTNAAPPKLVA